MCLRIPSSVSFSVEVNLCGGGPTSTRSSNDPSSGPSFDETETGVLGEEWESEKSETGGGREGVTEGERSEKGGWGWKRRETS